jgi:hypothetical protein
VIKKKASHTKIKSKRKEREKETNMREVKDEEERRS